MSDDELAPGLGTDSRPLPRYPRLASARQLRIEQHPWKARAWAGSPERLVQIQNLILDQLERAYDDAVKNLSDTEEDRYEAWELGESLSLKVSVKGNGGRMTQHGELSSIFSTATDVSEVEELHFKAGETLSLSFVRNDTQGERPSSVAVKLKVSGSDQAWALGTLQLLSSEIARGVPKWAVLRHGLVSYLLAVMMVLGVGGALVAQYADHLASAIVVLATVGSLGAGLLASVVIWPLMLRLFPGFDVVPSGASPTGRRTLGVAFTAFNFLVGVAGIVLAFVLKS
jgi:hypothetical protein